MRHGDKSPFGNTFIELTEINEQLSKPFHLLYSGSKVCLLKFKWKGHLNHIEFHLQQKVEAAAFPDDKEPLWSTNFKRSISSILQVDLSGMNNYIYSDKEVISLFTTYYYYYVFIFFLWNFSFQLSLYGKCGVNYYSSPLGENQHSVTKHRDLDSCPELPLGRWRTFIDMPSCPGGGQQV